MSVTHRLASSKLYANTLLGTSNPILMAAAFKFAAVFRFFDDFIFGAQHLNTVFG